MIKIGLDIGTGFVKCVSNYGSVRFPSLYVKRIHGTWTERTTEAVGTEAQSMLTTMGAAAIAPISRGRPDARYQKQAEYLILESMEQIRGLTRTPIGPDAEISMVVGLPYHAFDYKESMIRIIKKTLNAKTCIVVAQASGTLIDLNQKSGIVVSIGQGTTEILVIDDFEVIDGESSQWASNFVTRKIDKFAHLDIGRLAREKSTCKKYAKIMAEHLISEIVEMSANYGDRYPIALSGGGLLLPGMNNELIEGLKKFKILIPENPVMSNARGLYKLLSG